jgi:hypothetical protein
VVKLIHKKTLDNYQTTKINEYINERNINLTRDQSKMVNSILERKPRRIILDRLSFMDDKGELIFTNNPSIIEKESIKHFQSQAGPIKLNHTETLNDLPTEWVNHYDPSLQNIQDEWWNDLTAPIEIEDLHLIFKN